MSVGRTAKLLIGAKLVAIAAVLAGLAAMPRSPSERAIALAKRDGVPGFALAHIAGNGQVRYESWGVRDQGAEAVHSGTRFPIASVSKTFTAAVILRLWDDGRLDLEDPVLKWIPEGPDGWKGITLRHLLHHTSGIPDFIAHREEVRRLRSREEAFRFIAALPPKTKPGERWEYSNSGYFLLGMVVERSSGRTLMQCLREFFLTPLAMSRTADLETGYDVQGFVPEGKGRKPGLEPNPVALFGCGGMVSSAEDLARWELALRRGEILTRRSQRFLTTPAPLSKGRTHPYGAGLFLDDDGTIWSSGQMPTLGFGACILRKDGRSVVVLTNSGRHRQSNRLALEFFGLSAERVDEHLQAFAQRR